jgi:hypothetical protein
MPIIGYVLLVASLGDFIYILFPLQLQNPNWELQTFAALVEQCWGFLIALALIFSRYLGSNYSDVREIELLALRVIRWIIITIAILLLLSTPLIIFDTFRLYRVTAHQISATDATKLNQIEQMRTQIEQGADAKIIGNIAQFIGVEPQIIQQSSLSGLKDITKQKLTDLENNIKTQVERIREEQSRQLIKSSARTLYCSLIIGFTLTWIWVKIGQFFNQLFSNLKEL